MADIKFQRNLDKILYILWDLLRHTLLEIQFDIHWRLNQNFQ
jgi:hypothetical protein